MMSYENGRFTYTSGYGEGDTTEIAPPGVSAMSALNGISIDPLPE